ncbi:delta-60 repeat domain-containing protein [Spirochaeta isovalerica]|uniref:Delta-60 repeat domain-containing protein n=1 Tax=Spirochaeta isovalerica TaxID=150 RepID=A0A841R5X4_9SPIO|nr:delta-60 repeat domain-containing protein [Spirochaeta isovalerica]MBB6478419.1 hypothetical protein [Spirochaeta isovalerica]
MKRLIYIILPLLLASLVLSSCEDIFHDASDLLAEIRDNAKGYPEPKRIFVGGDFSIMWDGYSRDSFTVLNGQGNPDGAFLSENFGIEIVGYTGTGNSGVQAFSLGKEYVYVAGNYGGYDESNTEVANPAYKNLHRYWLDGTKDGTMDLSYSPFSDALSTSELYAVSSLSDSTAFAGGNFDPMTVPMDGYSELIGINSSGTGTFTIPAIPDGSVVYSVETVFDDTLTIVCGTFSTLGSETGYSNFAAIDNTTLTAIPFGVFPPNNPPLSFTQALDSAWYGDSLYIVGYETAMMEGGVLKYKATGTGFIEDTNFYSNFTSKISPTIFDQPYTIATDSKGRIYVGGSFYVTTENEHQGIIRLNSDGNVDESFRTMIAGAVRSIEVQKNGKILIGGSYTQINGESNYNGLARILENGNIDYEFDNSFPGGTVYAIAIQEEPQDTE